MIRLLAILFLLALSGFAFGSALPLKVAPGGRYLLDNNNNPFLIIADAPHNLFSMYTASDAVAYLGNRKTNVFNTLWIECITGEYTAAHTDGSNANGDTPFTNTITSGIYDLTTPNPAYWNYCSNVVIMCATNGLQALLDSIETGQYTSTALANGSNRCWQYGAYLGRFFGGFTNVMWITGNDFGTYATATNNQVIHAIALGIQSADTNHLQTVQMDNAIASDYHNTLWRDVLTLNGAYSYYWIAYDFILQAWNTNTMPAIFLEGPYEGETWSTSTGGTPNNLRRTEYWSLLNGSLSGFMWGNHYIWGPITGWQSHLNTTGTTNLGYFSNFFGTRQWYTLVPDQTHKYVTAGYGTKTNGTVFNEDSDYAVSAINANGTLGVAYTPVAHTLTVTMTNFVSYVTNRWFDPSAGTFTAISGSPFANTVTTNLATPGNNAAGEGDWVLLSESGSPATPAATYTKTYAGGTRGGGTE